MIVLSSTTQSLIVILTGTTPAAQYTVSTEEFGADKFSDPTHVSTVGAASTTSAAETTLLAAPAAGGRKVVRRLTIRNTHASNSFTAQLFIKDGSTNYSLGATSTIAGGAALVIPTTGLPQLFNATGTAMAAA